MRRCPATSSSKDGDVVGNRCVAAGQGGRLRLKAARKLGIAEISVILCDEWMLAQVKAFRLMVNSSMTWAD